MHTNVRLLLASAVILSSGALGAQTAVTPWTAYYGCWEAVEPSGTGAAPMTCILPSPENAFAARVVMLRGEETLRSSEIVANGTRVALEDAQCTGWEAASFSEDGARLYLVGESTCGESPLVRLSGMYSILPNGTWLDVSGARSGEGERLQVQRSRPVQWYNLPKSVASELEPLASLTLASRLTAARSLRLEDVVETSARVDAGVTEVWIAETSFEMPDNALRLTVRDLRTLAAADVPTRVIDMLVAAANPSQFAVTVSQDGVASAVAVAAVADGGSASLSSAWGGEHALRFSNRAQCQSMFSGYGLPPFGFYGLSGFPMMYSGLYSCFGANSFGFWGADGPMWWMQNGWMGYGDRRRGPILVTVDRTSGGTPRKVDNGRVVRGRGYSSGTGTTAEGAPRAQPRDATVRTRPPAEGSSARPRSSGSSSGGASSGGSSRGSSSGGSSGGSSSGSSGRTAKPRTP